MEWGEAIEVNGVRPDWLRDDEVIVATCRDGFSFGQERADYYGPNDLEPSCWWTGHLARDGDVIDSFQLPADHPYYTVQAHNAKHGTNFAYWPGGDNAPDDWDGAGVIFLSGEENHQGLEWRWTHDMGYANIIGYTRKAPENPVYGQVSVRRITETDAYNLIRDHDYDIVKVLDSLGIIRPCTREDRFTQETGITVTPDVRAALEWKE